MKSWRISFLGKRAGLGIALPHVVYRARGCRTGGHTLVAEQQRGLADTLDVRLAVRSRVGIPELVQGCRNECA